MKVVYIAGPFRAENYWLQVLNIRKAEALALEVWKLGAACICPHLNTAHFQGATPDYIWLKGDLEIAKRCDAVLLCENWTSSEGATAERHAALKMGIPVFDSLAKLESWLKHADGLWSHTT